VTPMMLKEFRWKKKGLWRAALVFILAVWFVVFCLLPVTLKVLGAPARNIALSFCILLLLLCSFYLFQQLYLHLHRNDLLRITREGIFYSHRGLVERTVRWTSIDGIAKDGFFRMKLSLTDCGRFAISYGFYFKRAAIRRILRAIIVEKKSPVDAVSES